MWAEKAVGWAVVLVASWAIVGLVARRRVGVCWTLVPYLAVSTLADLLMLLRPEQYFTQPFWFGKELVIHLLRFALALELTYRTFRAFPSARAAARGLLLAVLLATLAVVLVGSAGLEVTEGPSSLRPLISQVQPRVVNGSIWLLTAIAGLILWYRLPVHPLHKAILVGLVPYLLVYSVSLNLIESVGWNVRIGVNYALTLAFLAVLIYWARAAWRRSDVPLQAGPPPVDATLNRVPS
jgi:hypothetical protein